MIEIDIAKEAKRLRLMLGRRIKPPQPRRILTGRKVQLSLYFGEVFRLVRYGLSAGVLDFLSGQQVALPQLQTMNPIVGLEEQGTVHRGEERR